LRAIFEAPHDPIAVICIAGHPARRHGKLLPWRCRLAADRAAA
jgi:hypothetical protein